MNHLPRKISLVGMLLGSSAFAADSKPWITVTAVDNDTQIREYESSQTTNAKSETSCTAIGITKSCTTTSTPSETKVSISRVRYVTSYVETETHRLKLSCSSGWARCSPLEVGEKFQASIDGTKVTVKMHEGGNMGKEIAIKYKLLDMRPKAGKAEADPKP